MNRRTFLTSTMATAGLAQITAMNSADAADAGGNAPRDIYELRVYHLRRGPQQKRFNEFYRHAAIPAYNRAGIEAVGVFGVAVGPESPSMRVLLTCRSYEQFGAMLDRVRSDPEFQEKGAEFINASPTDPSYVRVESKLMRAFPGMPRLEIPAAAKEHQPRLFELRMYENHSKRANLKKIEMFDRGEIEIFRNNGLTPVFFGETLVGDHLPNLTYMLVFDNFEAREHNWGRFGGDPAWRKLSSTPGYTDPEIVSNISNMFLRPAPYSQI